MIRLTFLRDHRCFRSGETLELRPGVNLLVGDQGCGKSTLLALLRSSKRNAGVLNVAIAPGSPLEWNVLAYDAERDNLRTQSQFVDRAFFAQVASHFRSHGEFNREMFDKLHLEPVPSGDRGSLVLLDEPDTALSVRSCRRLVAALQAAAARGVLVVAAAHNPEVIAACPEVLSLEHRRWMPSDEFLALHRADGGTAVPPQIPAPSR